MSTKDATPEEVASSEGLGLEPERKKLDEFDWHEALDRASLFASLVDVELLQLAAVQSDDKVREKIELAATALAESYQILGRRVCSNRQLCRTAMRTPASKPEGDRS